MVLKERFHKNVVLFEIDGINMIGNNFNGAFLGLDARGSYLVKEIMEKGQAVDISHDDEKLINALNENNFFQKEDEHSFSISSAYVHVTDRCNLHCVGCYSMEQCQWRLILNLYLI